MAYKGEPLQQISKLTMGPLSGVSQQERWAQALPWKGSDGFSDCLTNPLHHSYLSKPSDSSSNSLRRKFWNPYFDYCWLSIRPGLGLIHSTSRNFLRWPSQSFKSQTTGQCPRVHRLLLVQHYLPCSWAQYPPHPPHLCSSFLLVPINQCPAILLKYKTIPGEVAIISCWSLLRLNSITVLKAEFPLWLSVDEPNQYPRGCGFNPWSHSVG